MTPNAETITLTKLFGNKRVHTIHFNKTGAKCFHIKVHEGTIHVSQNRYSMDSGNWLDVPKNDTDTQSHHLLKAGEEKTIHYTIGKIYHQPDKIFIMNHHLFQSARFSIYEITAENI